MIDAVRQTIERYQLLQSGDRVIVALSGGADSTALLYILYSIKETYDLTLYAAHLNHLIRGEEATRDEHFCKILCENYNIPLFTRRSDVPALAAQRGVSEELCGRQERYRFFEELSREYGAKVATAHTASDNAETLLFHLARGTSVKGAAGIPPKRGVYIRPLIACTRDQIERCCADNALDFVTDSTNLSDDYTRNKLRHRVIPVLKELNPGLEDAVTRFCESAALTNDYLHRQALVLLDEARSEYGYRAQPLLKAHKALLYTALELLCQSEAGFAAETRHIALLESVLKQGGAVDLGAYTAVCKQKLLRFVLKNQEKNNLEIPFDGEISFRYRDKLIAARADVSDAGSSKLVFRTMRGKDRFTFIKRGITKPLRKAFNEQKIPAEQRGSLLLLCCGETVLWCEALGYSKQGEALQKTAGLEIESAPAEQT